jgi:hypothetical protein
LGKQGPQPNPLQIAINLAQIDLQARISIPVQGVEGGWHIYPRLFGLMVNIELQEHDSSPYIAVVSASVAMPECHADFTQCFKAFLRLYDADRKPERVLAFVRRYGVADFCPHPYRDGNEPDGGAAIPWRSSFWCDECQWGSAVPRLERVESYVRCARQLRAALTIAAELRLNRRKHSKTDVNALYFDDLESDSFFYSLTVPEQWHELASVAYCWLERSQPRLWPSLVDDGKGVNVQIHPSTLLQLLAVQFLAAITATKGVYKCHDCREPFQRDRQPRSDHPPRCDECVRLRKNERNQAYSNKPKPLQELPEK